MSKRMTKTDLSHKGNCRLGMIIPAILLLMLTTKAMGSDRTVSLGTFESKDHGWSYYGGYEFKGARGTLTRSTEEKRTGDASLKLFGDFSKGGAYVAAQKMIPRLRLKALRFWVKSPELKQFNMRITDKTGQVFQHTVKPENLKDWQLIEMTDLAKTKGSWGGANDKVFHQPATHVSIMLGGGPDKKGTLYIDDVEAVSPGLDEPWTAELPLKETGAPMVLSCTEKANIKRWQASGHLKGNPVLRNRISSQPGAFNGKDAVLVEVTHPRIMQEWLKYPLNKNETGKVWTKRDYDYISFWYKTDDGDGTLFLRLNSYESRIYVRPGDWTRVVLPLRDFYSTRYAPGKPYSRMSNVSSINTLEIRSNANSLRKPTKILMAQFTVGSFAQSDAIRAVDRTPLELAHGWKGAALADIAAPVDEGIAWKDVATDSTWQSVGTPKAFIARNRFFIPNEWRGMPLILKGDNPIMGTVQWNDTPLTIGNFSMPVQPNCVIPADQIKWGAVNTITLRVQRDAARTYNNTILGLLSLQPQLSVLTLRPAGGSVADERLPSRFDMGAQPPKTLDMVFRFADGLFPATTSSLQLGLTDFYFRRLALTSQALQGQAPGAREVVLRLDEDATRKLYYGEFFEYSLAAEDGSDAVPFAITRRVTDLCYAGRDTKALPPLPETWEETAYGRLKLVDEIDCSLDPAQDEHPYKEGGINWHRWVQPKYYYFWEDGIQVKEILGRKCRVASNSSWFSYRIGRNLTPGKTYVLRVEYPEDVPRYSPMNVDLGVNYTCPGFRTGVSPEDPFDNFPLSGSYQHYDNIITPDTFTYGYQPRWMYQGHALKSITTAPSQNGVWVDFIDVGGHARHYAKTQFAGPAVSRIKLYEIDPVKNAPRITKPEGLPERILMMAWEREPAVDPMMTARTAKLMGWNAIAPEILKWHFTAYWPTERYMQQDPRVPFKPLPEGVTMNTLKTFLDAAEAMNIYMVPRIEYGGSYKLPKEARCIGPNGKPAKMARYCSWGADLLHPDTWKDFEATIDEVIGTNHDKYSCLKLGMLWRMRCGRMTISYSPFDVKLFCDENNIPMPKGNAKAQAKWASSGAVGKKYEAWWQKKRMEFSKKVRDKLQSIDPAMKLIYYNWDKDGWTVGHPQPRDHKEWTLLYDNETKDFLYKRELETFAKYDNNTFVNMVKNKRSPIEKAVMEHYRDVKGIAYLAPVCLRYVADNPEFLEYFRTGDGLAVDHQVLYEETIAHFKQHDGFEGSMITSGGPAFAMAPEFWAWFHGDANTLSFSTYTFGRGFADAHRRFAQAFLALPAIPGKVINQDDKDVRVRTYPSANGTYVGIGHRGYAAKKITVTLPVAEPKTITDLVTGKPVPFTMVDGKVRISIEIGPLELNAYLIN